MLIGNGTVLTFGERNRMIEDGAVLVNDDTIEDVGKLDELRRRYGDEDFIDAGNGTIMPGFICAHTHLYGAFARGMPLKDEPPRNFVEILEKLWWKLDGALTAEDVYYSSLVCLIECIKNGTTTVFDHHAGPRFISGSLDIIEKACIESGIRGCLCYEVTDRNGEIGAEYGIRENERFIKKVENDKNLISASFGLHASLTLSNETLRRCAEVGKELDSGFHIHVAEDAADNIKSGEHSGKTSVRRLSDAGILRDKTIAAHCVHVTRDDMKILKKTGAYVVHNPESNMNNAVGTAPVIDMLKIGIPVSLGTDGFTFDMMREMKVAYILHKLSSRDPRVMGADTVIKMAYRNNSLLASKYFKKPVGELSKGAYADIVILDYHPPTPMNIDNFPWHLQFGMSSMNVHTVLCAGRILMKDRELLTLDEGKIHEKARAKAEKVWERI